MIPKPKPFAKGCTGKVALPTFELANTAAKQMRRKYQTGCAVEPYHCPHCGKWHVGQAEKRRKRFKREEVSA